MSKKFTAARAVTTLHRVVRQRAATGTLSSRLRAAVERRSPDFDWAPEPRPTLTLRAENKSEGERS
ncbi:MULTISPECIES: hypothetical protein [unclassified Pseudoclavibacter]|uniref:hypothetical protein n=1 Tax=unclassified Pseudoclavibacter TaxID=2615177 RepID=UPI001BAAFA9A|nr:hypothetical protein [Pseudoclavibacter sp. Marseille-Q4354]MBS3180028.1 hypothetical protein [Pseudoclavibacter sp. Marseille-Q4354]